MTCRLTVIPTCRGQLQLSSLCGLSTETHFIPDIVFFSQTMRCSSPVFFDTRFQFKISTVITESLISFSFFSFLFKPLWITAFCSLEALVPLILSTFTNKQIQWHSTSGLSFGNFTSSNTDETSVA